MEQMQENDISQAILERIMRQTQPFGEKGCFCWVGTKTGGRKSTVYGKMRFKLPSDSESCYYYVHRLCYMAVNKIYKIPNELHVSHLCHFSLCVNPEHLSLEPPQVNVDRQQCGDVCKGHNMGGIQFQACILW
jgi:hypothetical protein